MLIDRETAKNNFNKTIESYDDWIYIIGKTGIGKSYFTKEIVKEHKTIYCEPNHYFDYWTEFFYKVKIHSRNVVMGLLNKGLVVLPNEKFLEDLSNDEIENLLEEKIRYEINSNTNSIAKFLGDYLFDFYSFIVLDNLYKCDEKSYKWLLPLLDKFSSHEQCYIVVICDEDKEWAFDELKNDIYDRFTRIEINKYDNSDAYYELINTVIHFDNSEVLSKISQQIYRDFQGSSLSILKLLSLLKSDTTATHMDDKSKKRLILKKASHLLLETVDNLNFFSKELLALLAISPINLSSKCISDILECSIIDVDFEIKKCLENELVEKYYNLEKSVTEYGLTDLFSKDTYTNQLTEIQIKYIYEKLYVAWKKRIINISNEQMVRITLKCNLDNINSLVYSYFSNVLETDSNNKAELLNEFLKICIDIPTYLCDMRYVNFLYKYGYYAASYKLITSIKDNNTNYEYLMKKGDIEHLILHKNTSKSFEKAANLPYITINQKLKAINRQIMALTQEGKQELYNARELYKKTITENEQSECDGLIELYRNANNIFSYDTALEYTIKGYKLAVKLNNGIEKIKTLHNICMLKLLNGNYYLDLNNNNLDVEPDFHMICHGFENRDEFRHELSYPLLDLGTLEMFDFVKSSQKEKSHLIRAKKYFSRAQLYAKSFYAKNIAEISLLIVNSYLHEDDTEYIRNARKRIFDKYMSSAKEIKDFRVHRKILFALATSAKITNDISEGKNYLLLSKPHVFEGETLRFNNLCDDLNMPNEKINYSSKDINKCIYYENSQFVPWLISFGH